MVKHINSGYMNRLIYLLLSLLGFATSCKHVAMYASPYSSFSFKGRVTDAKGKPVSGVSVKVGFNEEVSTDDKGEFVFDVKRSGVYGDDVVKETVDFMDVDGAENGWFDDKCIEVTFTRDSGVKPDGWYLGHYNAPDAEVVLAEKKSSDRQ